jgi:hypothetical protein
MFAKAGVDWLTTIVGSSPCGRGFVISAELKNPPLQGVDPLIFVTLNQIFVF